MADQCEMIIGYLVPHRCEHNALGRCIQCGRSYCDEHLSVTAEGMKCLACQQGLAQPVMLPVTAAAYSQSDFEEFAAASEWDQDDDTFSDLS